MLIETLSHIFGAEDFVERHHCGDWGDFWIALYVLSNVSIVLAYCYIPWQIRIAKSRVRSGKVSPQGFDRIHLSQSLSVVGVFVFFCAIGHVLDQVLSFAHPAYRLCALWHFATSIVSWRAALFIRRNRNRFVVVVS